MNTLNDTLYYALQGLETRLAMQYNRPMGWSCRQIVRTGVEVARVMLGDEDVEAHKDSYYTLISRRMSSDPRETMMVIVVMRVLFGLIENDSQARRCRTTFANDWCDEIEDIYRSYRRAVDEQIDIELTKQPHQIFTVTVMENQQNNQYNNCVIYNAPVYNTNTTNHYYPQQPAKDTKEDAAEQETPQFTLPVPTEGKYSEVRKYIEERKRFDEEFKNYCTTHSLRDLCTRLTKEFGWFVDENSLQRNLNRNR